MLPLNLLYREPDPDRWIRGDRYPRKIIRRLLRGKPNIGGMQRYFVNLCAGLDRLRIPYRINDLNHLRRHPDEVACVVGKPGVLKQVPAKNPIVFGPAVYSHPIDEPLLFERYAVRRVLVSCHWMRQMFEQVYGPRIDIWAAGIDTDTWQPTPDSDKNIDVLIYDKIRWDHDRYACELIEPLKAELNKQGLSTATIRYGQYREANYQALLSQARWMLFLCEHETQGFAYLQALSAGVPILAWDRGECWRDPAYYPDRVQFAPVTSVPYFDDRCGMRFTGAVDFACRLDEFLVKARRGDFNPRQYVLDHLTLEQCAQNYVDLVTRPMIASR